VASNEYPGHICRAALPCCHNKHKFGRHGWKPSSQTLDSLVRGRAMYARTVAESNMRAGAMHRAASFTKAAERLENWRIG